jgi:hypothetical protein
VEVVALLHRDAAQGHVDGPDAVPAAVKRFLAASTGCARQHPWCHSGYLSTVGTGCQRSY